MSQLSLSPPLSEQAPGSDGPYLRGRWLVFARTLWLLLAAGLLANWIASLIAYYGLLKTICDDIETCQSWQPTSGNAQALHRLGFSLDGYAAYFISVEVIVSLVFMAVAAIIFWRKSQQWLGLFVSFVLLLFGAFGISGTLNGTFGDEQTPLLIDLFIGFLGLVQWPCLGALLVTFPTGRFVPRWTWVIVVLWVTQVLFFIAPAPYGIAYWPGWLVALELLMTYGSTAAVLLYRYLRVFTPVQRQQTKWVVFGVASGVLINTLSSVIQVVVPGFNAPDAPYQLLSGLFTAFLFLPIPLSIGIAILRYRLWDIDTLINKALVYGLLTGILGALYAALVLGLASQVSEEPVIIVISTLLIAALFQPLRRRLQTIIDRRFYRKKYDAARTLAAFSATLRQEVDLNDLREHLLAVVHETMQPAQVSLWLRSPEKDRASEE
ncbi:MAG TPA: hypothetical protein VFU32_10820 [Ktedonobacterales bacterium]|nr:hypothetical protein [Ktedonobacterales bacterium]